MKMELSIDNVISLVMIIAIIWFVGITVTHQFTCEITKAVNERTNLRIACYTGCQIEPEKTGYQLGMCYGVCQKQYPDLMMWG